MSEETMQIGEITEVLFFDTALSPEEISIIMERVSLQLNPHSDTTSPCPSPTLSL